MGNRSGIVLLVVVLAVHVPLARADSVTDANAKAAEIVSKPPVVGAVAARQMAIVQVSVFESVGAITGRYPAQRTKVTAAPGASVDAAVAAATRTALTKLLPAQQAAIDAYYQSAIATIPEGPSKANGIAVGEKAAAAVVLACADDGSAAPNTYRPHAVPGVYVPTAFPLVPQWAKRRPWIMSRPDQFRPGPPPSLTSETWKRDFEEIKALGGKTSTRRTPEQTAMAQFWEATAPVIYWPVARSVAKVPGRDPSDNARLLAVAAMAMDDALIAVFEAKYTYNFWRPVTAIRNADGDMRDPGWTPFIDTPMHPEYPCAHCILSAALGAVLRAELGSGPTPTLTTSSPTAGGAERSWTSITDFEREVASARIYDGVHYRNSTEVGSAMGSKIGELAAKSVPRALSSVKAVKGVKTDIR